MGSLSSLIAVLLLPLTLTASSLPLQEESSIHRRDFPADFVFGSSISAYQYEGAAFEDGKGPGIWDTFTHKGQMMDGSTGDVASDGYHRFKEDVKLISDTGFDGFRLSVAWTRLIPDGHGEVNPKGVEFYNNFINELLDQGIQPFVTLNHFDLPQTLEDEYGGWINSRVVDDFLTFADICFSEFGDRVKHWITINEPNAFGELGYSEGILAPKHCSLSSMECEKGNSSTEPYLAAHNMLLAHAAAVKLYREKYQKNQGGSIGIAVLAYWYWPKYNDTTTMRAWQRALDFHIGWIIEPLLYGRYPRVMERIVGDRLPSFTESEAQDLLNSFDFLALNHYSTLYVYDTLKLNSAHVDYAADMGVDTEAASEDEAVPVNNNLGFGPVPLGFQQLLEYMKDHYGNPPVFVTECGYPTANNDTIPMSVHLNDTTRVDYFDGYIKHLLKAIRNGANTRGFFAWTIVDGFEYALGYTYRFGLHYVDIPNDLTRRPKLSAEWFKRLLLPRQGSKLSRNNSPQVASI